MKKPIETCPRCHRPRRMGGVGGAVDRSYLYCFPRDEGDPTCRAVEAATCEMRAALVEYADTYDAWEKTGHPHNTLMQRHNSLVDLGRRFRATRDGGGE